MKVCTNLPKNDKNVLILEALSIVMLSSYNGQFLGELFAKIDGLTTEGQ